MLKMNIFKFPFNQHCCRMILSGKSKSRHSKSFLAKPCDVKMNKAKIFICETVVQYSACIFAILIIMHICTCLINNKHYYYYLTRHLIDFYLQKCVAHQDNCHFSKKCMKMSKIILLLLMLHTDDYMGFWWSSTVMRKTWASKLICLSEEELCSF